MTGQSHLVFRCDASPYMGTGHAMRCLTLANVWRDEFGGTASFCCAEIAANLEDRIKNHGHLVIQVDNDAQSQDGAETLVHIASSQNARAIIIDGYQFDKGYRAPLAAAPFNVVSFRDAGSETFGANIVIDTAPHASAPKKSAAVYLCGPSYALVAPHILEARRPESAPKGILITFGGSDPHLLSAPVAKAIRNALPDIPIHVVLGGGVENAAEISRELSRIPIVSVSHDVPSLGAAIVGAELVISAAGSSLYEVAALARPMILAITEDNQSALGALNWAETIDVRSNADGPQLIADATARLYRNKTLITELGTRASTVVDGNGARRILERILSLG